MIKTITSRTNPLIKHVATLQHTKHRNAHQQFIAEGNRTCATLINVGNRPINLFVVEHMLPTAQHMVADKHITLVTPHVMEKISTATTPSGLLGVFSIPPTPAIDTLTAGIVLVHMNNPGNVGTLIRTSAAMNKKSVVLIEGVDPWNPKVIQASAGTIGLVTIFQLTWPTLIKQKGAQKLCALVVSDGKKPQETDFQNTLLVIGSEAHGIPQQWVDQCEQKLTLAMPGGVESLNAAVAGSIALYFANR